MVRKLAVLTSGGDAPGMNAAIRAVVRAARGHGLETYGVRRGFAGLLANEIVLFSSRDVGGILQLGGTVLGSARCPEFKQGDVQKRAVQALRALDIDALVVIGGNGSQAGSAALSRLGFPVVGVASTIDNDLYGTEVTIGVDTALNIALETIDRLRTTASSHQRAFLVEVMGRNSGYLALMAGIAGGAETIVLPEREIDPEEVANDIHAAYERGKTHAIVVVAEGAKYDASALVQYFSAHRERLGFELRATILGHAQRGGTPTFADRLLATRLGSAAVDVLVGARAGVLVGISGGNLVEIPLQDAATKPKPLDFSLLEMTRMLAQ